MGTGSDQTKLFSPTSSQMLSIEERKMQKVAVFGNAGGGKSTLSKRLAQFTGLPLIALDLLKYTPGGEEVPHAEYKAAHDQSEGTDLMDTATPKSLNTRRALSTWGAVSG